MAIFEELELWDSLIACYRLLQKKPQARCPPPQEQQQPDMQPQVVFNPDLVFRTTPTVAQALRPSQISTLNLTLALALAVTLN
jgi:hypothetical protein